MITISVNGQIYKVKKPDNLLKVCLSLGFDIPYFCWHPKLGSIGACRQCAVTQFHDIHDKKGHIVMSCMTPIVEGMLISLEDPLAREFRKNIIELLMINHPHDCPVCAEGGHCHLQDMTVMTGHAFRKYRFTKRTHYNQNIGPFINHEMNRCITCYRCVRYYKDYADGKDFNVYGVHDNLYFGRFEDGILENEFSGNLVEICPTGVFTDKTYSKNYTRKWDMQFSPSICHQCSVGCNISPGERYGELRRIENRYNSVINHYFLCDRGRFGYGYVNRKDRPLCPQQKCDNDHIILSAQQAVYIAADILRQANRIIGIGSPRASMESNFALRQLVGEENFSTGLPQLEQRNIDLIIKILTDSGIHTPSLFEIETYDAILILGEDITQVAPRVALSVRQAVKAKARAIATEKNIPDWHISGIFNIGQDAKYPLFLTNVDVTRLDDIATWSYHASIEDQARLGFSIAHKLDNRSPMINDCDKGLSKNIDLIVKDLLASKKPLIICGIHSGSSAMIEAAANIAKALKLRGANVGITLLSSSANSMGVGLIGGKSLDCILNTGNIDKNTVMIILENDLYRYWTKKKVDLILSKASSIIVLDHQRTKTFKKAGFVFSSASFAESDGTLINFEGRAQRFFQVYAPNYYNNQIAILESWRWLYALYSIIHHGKLDWTTLDKIIDDLILALPHLKNIKHAAPTANFRVFGQKIARLPHRASGRTAIRSNISVHEPRQPQDQDTMFAFSMEGYNQPTKLHSQIPFAWAPNWNSTQAWNKFQDEVGGKLRHGDPGVRILNTKDHNLSWFQNIPKRFLFINEWYIVPYYQLIGSEEMSQRSPLFQKIMSPAKIVLNPIDAEKLGINNGALVKLFINEDEKEILCLPVRFASLLQSGLIGVPIGMPGIPTFLLGEKINRLEAVNEIAIT